MSCPVVFGMPRKITMFTRLFQILELFQLHNSQIFEKESTTLMEVTGLVKKGCDMLQYKSIVFLAITQLFINILNTMHSTRCMVKSFDYVTHGMKVCEI